MCYICMTMQHSHLNDMELLGAEDFLIGYNNELALAVYQIFTPLVDKLYSIFLSKLLCLFQKVC